jgi:hypothetical protein
MLGDDAPGDIDKSKKRVHRKTHGKVGFAEMARLIGSKWKNLPSEPKKEFEDRAGKEKKRYATELAAWKEVQKRKLLVGNKHLAESQNEKPKEGDGSSSMPQMDANAPDSFRLQMMTDGVSRRNLSIFQQRGQDLPTIDYLRALQERQTERALLAGRSNMDPSLFQYPSAAEASANAILQQFQGIQQVPTQQFQGLQQSQLQQATGMDTSSREFDRLQQMARYPNNMVAAAELQQMGQMGSSRGQGQFDLPASRDFERLQQLQLFQSNMGGPGGDMPMQMQQGGGQQPQQGQYGAGAGDLDRFQQLQYQQAMRRLQQRYNM